MEDPSACLLPCVLLGVSNGPNPDPELGRLASLVDTCAPIVSMVVTVAMPMPGEWASEWCCIGVDEDEDEDEGDEDEDEGDWKGDSARLVGVNVTLLSMEVEVEALTFEGLEPLLVGNDRLVADSTP